MANKHTTGKAHQKLTAVKVGRTNIAGKAENPVRKQSTPKASANSKCQIIRSREKVMALNKVPDTMPKNITT